MNFKVKHLINLYVLQALIKGFTTFYFVLLPVFILQLTTYIFNQRDVEFVESLIELQGKTAIQS